LALLLVVLVLLAWACAGQQTRETPETGRVTAHSSGLHGYIGFSATRPPARSEYSAGMGFYSAVWPLLDRPLADFQIGLAGCWITPDNSDNKDTALAPEGTLARTWRERGPTWDSVFQTLEGGLGYWAGNHFRYGSPKFSLNATPQCYDYEVGSPGWSFFYSNEALPDNQLSIAQLSNRLLIPPDGLPFQGNPNGQFLGYTWMALPFTEPTPGDPPTGDQSWTCFLSAANFKGPIAYYIPETWSKIGKLFKYPFLYGRGLDARPGNMGGGAMEINTVPRFDSQDARGTVYSKIPRLQFPVDGQGRTLLVQDVTYYSKAALYNGFKAWRDGGAACSGRFDEAGAWKSTLTTRTTRYDQGGMKLAGVERVFDTKVFEGNVWGLEWFNSSLSPNGLFPQYYQQVGEERIAVAAADVPAETRLPAHEFKLAARGEPYTSPSTGAWARPGPKLGPFTVQLADGSLVTYSWYRFVDQPSFQQYDWSEEKKAKLQAMVEKLHATWAIDRDYMAPPTQGALVTLDPALLVTPPNGLEAGYVPIVTRQTTHTADAPQKALPLPGEAFLVQGRTAFVILPSANPAAGPIPWVWYAPTLPGLPSDAEKWMFERFTRAGVAIAGIDVGESYGSPDGRALYSALYGELTTHRGFAPRAVMLGRSRGGLMTLCWAVENADKVAGFAGIYPVCNLASYPGAAKASAAYRMSPEQFSARLAEHNPIDRLEGLAKAGVPLFAIQGDSDQAVPLEANSGELRKRYEALGGKMQLIVPPGQGHNMWPGFFQCRELLDFVLAQATRTNTPATPRH